MAIQPPTASTCSAVGGWIAIFPFAVLGVRERRDVARLGADVDDDSEAGTALADALRTPAFWLLGTVLFLFYFYYLGVNNHLVAFLSDAGFSDAAAARQYSAAIAVGIAGKIGMGLVGDRIPARRARDEAGIRGEHHHDHGDGDGCLLYTSDAADEL